MRAHSLLEILLFFMVILVAGCASDTQSARKAEPGVPPVDTVRSTLEYQGLIRLTGTMHLIPVENGCWQFTANNGTGYELYGAQMDSLRSEGAEVVLRVRLKPNMKGVCMVGIVAEVMEIISVQKH